MGLEPTSPKAPSQDLLWFVHQHFCFSKDSAGPSATRVTSPLGKGKLVCNYVIINHPEAQLMRFVTLPEEGGSLLGPWRKSEPRGFLPPALSGSVFSSSKRVKPTEFRAGRVCLQLRAGHGLAGLIPDPAWMNGAASAPGILLE